MVLELLVVVLELLEVVLELLELVLGLLELVLELLELVLSLSLSYLSVFLVSAVGAPPGPLLGGFVMGSKEVKGGYKVMF